MAYGLPHEVLTTLNDTYFLSLLKTTHLTRGSSISSTFPIVLIEKGSKKTLHSRI